MDIHGCSYFGLQPNTILLLKLFQFGPWGVLLFGSFCPFDIPWSLWLFLFFGGGFWHFLALQDAPDSFCIFPAPALESAISLRSPWFLSLESRCQDLDAPRAHCCWGIVASKPSSWQNEAMYMCVLTHTHIYISVDIFIRNLLYL